MIYSDPTGLYEQGANRRGYYTADGLTQEQWMETSRPGGGGFAAQRAYRSANAQANTLYRNSSEYDNDGNFIGGYYTEYDSSICTDNTGEFATLVVRSPNVKSKYYTHGLEKINTFLSYHLGGGAVFESYLQGVHTNNEVFYKYKSKPGYSNIFNKNWKNPGAIHWRDKALQQLGRTGKYKLSGLSKLGGVLVAGDILASGQVKPSHFINAVMIAASGTGIGAVLAGAWFIADFGTGGINYISGNGFRTLGDVIDERVEEKYGKFEMYEGLY